MLLPVVVAAVAPPLRRASCAEKGRRCRIDVVCLDLDAAPGAATAATAATAAVAADVDAETCVDACLLAPSMTRVPHAYRLDGNEEFAVDDDDDDDANDDDSNDDAEDDDDDVRDDVDDDDNDDVNDGTSE
jgi:hypothetical protein